MNQAIGLDFLQPGAPKLDRARRYSLLPFEISRCDLNDSLVKLAVLSVIFQPDLFQCFMTFEEQLLIEFLDTFEKTRIVFCFHSCSAYLTAEPFLCSLRSLWLVVIITRDLISVRGYYT